MVVSLVDQARACVDDPESWYAILRRPDDEHDDGTWISAYASNEFGESCYLGGDREGAITWQPDL